MDLAVSLGLRRGAASGAVAADFDGDDDLDLYLGRDAGEGFMFRNGLIGSAQAEVEQPKFLSAPAPKRLCLNFNTVGNANRSLIGTQVTVTGGGFSQTKYISGGSGRGGQPSNQLVFGLSGLSEAETTVQVDVQFPFGKKPPVTCTVNQPTTITADMPVEIKLGSSDAAGSGFGYNLTPGHSEWVFRWRTGGQAGERKAKGDIEQDSVRIENNRNYAYGDPCFVGIEPGGSQTLRWGDPGVANKVYWDGFYWQHELRWSGLSCATGCRYRFYVTSGLGNGTTTTSGATATTPSSYCLPDN